MDYRKTEPVPSPLKSIRYLSETLCQYSNVDDMMNQVLRTILDVIGADAGSVLLADEKAKQLVFRYAVGKNVDCLHRTSIPWDKGVVGDVFRSGRPAVVPAAQLDMRHVSSTHRITGYESRDMIVVPLKRRDGTPIGIIEVLNTVTGRIDHDDLDIVVIIASIASAAIERADDAEVTRLKDLQLQQSHKMETMGRLTEYVAHDFNNFLTVMRGFTKLIITTLDPSALSRQHADEVIKVVEQASGLTNQLLAFSRNQIVEPQIVNLNGLVANIEKILRMLIGKDIALMTNLDPYLGQVKADPGQIGQVIMNLCVNARDAMPNGGSLTIETAMTELGNSCDHTAPGTRPGRFVLLSVTDTGSGMDQAVKDKLFEPFFTTKAPGKGNGLGLSIVYGIVKQHHGHMAVASDVGHGTTFNIYLPLVEASGTGARSVDLAPALAQRSEWEPAQPQ